VVALVLLAGLAAGGYELWRHEHKSSKAHSGGGTPPAAAATVHLTASTAYDPTPGNGHERNDLLSRAVDGDPATYWQTEHYTTAAFGNLKKGVGIVFDAGSAVRLAKLRVRSDTPGFRAVVKAGAAAKGPFDDVSSNRTVGSDTTFDLNPSSPERYYMLWLTSLPSGDQAHVNEVSAVG
jgi:hypothetical protein